MSERQASNALLTGIEHIVKEEIKKAPIDKTYTAIIKSVKDNNLYDIFMQGQTYTDVPSIFQGLKVNATVKVKIPQNQYSSMYIEGKLNIDYSTTSNNYKKLINLPQINGVTLIDNKTLEELGAERVTNMEIERLFN